MKLHVTRTAIAFALLLGASTVGLASKSGVSAPQADDEMLAVATLLPGVNGTAIQPNDAPFGVDPVVTGPVSAAFKARRAAAGCDTAVWPNIPAACYPD